MKVEILPGEDKKEKIAKIGGVGSDVMMDVNYLKSLPKAKEKG